MTEPLSWQQLAQPGAVVALVSLLLLICKSAVGYRWTNMINGIGAIVFGMVISVCIGVYFGFEDPVWVGYVLAAINGIVYAGATLGVTTRYSAKVQDDQIRGAINKVR